jgi:His-Xaa-Ser system radical SAM maturase HxsC
MRPRQTHARIAGLDRPVMLKVVTLEEFARRGLPPAMSALWMGEDPAALADSGLFELEWGACLSPGAAPPPAPWKGPWISGFQDEGVVSPGDVIVAGPGSSMVRVAYRRGSNGNVLFLTERCDNRCLMCSQPPREVEDGWRLQETLNLIRLIDPDEPSLGITGGEPALLGEGLAEILRACRDHLPETRLQVLTNGRRFGTTPLARQVAAVGHPSVLWGIPLYADTAARHDYIVQARGAFGETLRGIYRLAEHGQAVEIRIVLHRASLPRLEQLAYYIFRNLPFAAHIALMGLEPIGLARGNRDLLWIDPAEYADTLASAVWFLANRGLPVSLYNLPLCLLPADLRPFARRSISDWKNDFPAECQGCQVRGQCAGFFASASPSWRSRAIRPLGSDGRLFTDNRPEPLPQEVAP